MFFFCQAVEEDNEQFLTDRQIFSPHYYRFLNNLIKVWRPHCLHEGRTQHPPAQVANPPAVETLDHKGPNSGLGTFAVPTNNSSGVTDSAELIQFGTNFAFETLARAGGQFPLPRALLLALSARIVCEMNETLHL